MSDGFSSLSYEELVALLEDLAGRMSSGDVGIEEAAELYEKATAVQKEAAARLTRVRERIETIDREGVTPSGL